MFAKPYHMFILLAVRAFLKHPLTHLPLDKMAATLADDNFKCIILNENDRIPIRFSLKFVPMSPIYNKQALGQVMACRLFGAKPLPEPILTQFTDTYMRWVNVLAPGERGCDLKYVVCKHILMISILSISFKIVFMWMPLEVTDDLKSITELS